MNRPRVRLVYGGQIYDTIDLDRVPVKGEVVWLNEQELFEVVEVHWRPDGGASLLVKKPSELNTLWSHDAVHHQNREDEGVWREDM